MIRSLKIRLLIGTLGATACVFLVAAGVLYWSIHRVLLDEFDATLLARGNALAALAEQSPSGIRTDTDPSQIAEYRQGKHPDFFVIATPAGTVIAKSESMADYPVTRLGTAASWRPELAFNLLPNGRPGRRISFRFTPHSDNDAATGKPQTACVVLACDTGKLHDKNRRLACLLGCVFALAVTAAGGALWWIVGRGLRPLHRLANEIQSIGSHSMSERVASRQVPKELATVVLRLNAMLENLESAFDRERAFTADVAHELRTPLAGMLMTLQVCASKQRTPEEYKHTVAACLQLTGDMRTMVETLLMLARIESGQHPPQFEPVDLRLQMASLWEIQASKAKARHIHLTWDMPAPLQVETDPVLFSVVIRNLFDNALAYADAGGFLRVTGHAIDGHAAIRITNSGSKVREEDADKVFDRFWRADPARESGEAHCGLGLTLCRRIIERLHGNIRIETVLGEHFTVELMIPMPASPNML